MVTSEKDEEIGHPRKLEKYYDPKFLDHDFVEMSYQKFGTELKHEDIDTLDIGMSFSSTRLESTKKTVIHI